MKFRELLLLINKKFKGERFISKDVLPWYSGEKHPKKNVSRDLLRVWKMGFFNRILGADGIITYELTRRGREYIDFLLYGIYPEYFMVNVIKIVLRKDAKRLMNLLNEMEELGSKEMFGAQSKFLLKVIEMLRTDLKAGTKMMFEHLYQRMFPG